MEITGIIVQKLGESKGTSAKTGMPWRNAEFLVEVPGEYKRHIKFKVRDGQYNLIARFEALIGKMATVSFNFDANEQEKDGKKTGRWFNEIMAWGVLEYKPEQLTAEQAMAQQAQQQPAQPAGDAAGTGNAGEPAGTAAQGSFDELMKHDAVAAQAKMLGEFQEHGTGGDDLPF